MSELTVAAGLARELIEFGVSKAADRKALVERSGIDPVNLQNLDRRIPFENYVALMRAGMELTGDPALALHFGEAVDMSEFSVLGFLGPPSGTMIDGLAQLNRYARLLIEVDATSADRFQLARRDGKLWLVDTRPNANDFPELTESTFTRMVCTARRFGLTSSVGEVHVTHAAPAHQAEYDRIFQGPVFFESDWNAIGIDESMLTLPVVPQPRYAFDIMRNHAEALLKSLDGSKSVRGSVEGLLVPMLSNGCARIDTVARRMGLSRQTLYRKLKAEGVTFEQVLDELRHKLALQYLDDAKVSVNEAAYLIGFSDRAGFSRAFKRWTGSSPGTTRR